MKINFDVETYRARFLGGARSYLFFCIFSFPQALGKDNASDNLKNRLTALGSSASKSYGFSAEQQSAAADYVCYT